MKNKKIQLIVYSVLLVLTMFVSYKWTVFKFKNPLCNDSAFYSHFWEVMKGEEVHYFQIK